MRPDKPARSVRLAKRLRRDLSFPETLLWQILRTSPGDHKFRKQHPAGPYILDFFCARANRIDTIHVAARDVLDSAEAVAQSIVDIVESRLNAFGKAPPSSLRDATSPSQVDGEDQKDRL